MLFVIGLLIFFNFKSLGKENIADTLPELAIFTVVLLRILPSMNKIITSLQRQNQFYAAIESVKDDLRDNEGSLNVKSYKKIFIDNFQSLELRNIFFRYPRKKITF